MSKKQSNPPDLTFIPAPSTSKNETEEKPKSKPKPKPKEPMTSTARAMKEKQLKDRAKEAQVAAEKNPNDLDKIIHDVQKLEEICSALKCKLKIKDFSITCNHCKSRFCTQHYLPEVHGCGDLAKKEARQKYLHPGAEKLPAHKKEQCEQKFQMKLREMQNSRKKANVGGKAGESKAKKK